MKTKNLILIGVAAVFLMAQAVYASQDQGQCQQREGGKKGGIYKELSLTLDQQKKLEANRKAQREEMTKLRAAIKEKETKLQEAMKNPAVTVASVQPLVNEIKSLQTQIIDGRISGIFAVKEILTPEQFAKFQQTTEKWQKNKKGRFHNWREKRKSTEQDQE